MMYFGRQGYTDSTRRIVKTTQFIASELRKIPGIFVYGDPQVCVVAFGSDRFDIYRLAQGLSELPNGRGWCLNALQFPPALHLCVTDLHTVEGRAEGFIRDVSTVAAELCDHPENYSSGAVSHPFPFRLMNYATRSCSFLHSSPNELRTFLQPSHRLRKIPGIFVYGDPQVCVVAFGSDRFDIYRLAQGLSELPNGRGWCLNALQFPPALHLCVTDLHTVEGRAEGFIRDVSTVAAELCDHPENYSSGA
ncbi:hypothetical protein CRM22_001959, partial [Opisthorchis felineus]